MKEEGVPQDLIYLAVAESGISAADSKLPVKGAGGMWQFMTFEGNEYGLTRNGYYDYRFDPEKATRGYARYIKSLYKVSSATGISRWRRMTGVRGTCSVRCSAQAIADFWELYRRNVMPAETRAYVPQILAAVIMAKNPEKYGLDKLTCKLRRCIYDTVTTSYSDRPATWWPM